MTVRLDPGDEGDDGYGNTVGIAIMDYAIKACQIRIGHHAMERTVATWPSISVTTVENTVVVIPLVTLLASDGVALGALLAGGELDMKDDDGSDEDSELDEVVETDEVDEADDDD